MRFVPNPWGDSRFAYVRAIVIGLFLLGGLMVAIQRGSLLAELIWIGLLTAAFVSWARDLVGAIRRKN